MRIKFLGRLFDFNGDGKTTLSEVWLARKIWEEVNPSEDTNSPEITPCCKSRYNAKVYTPAATSESATGGPNHEPDQTDQEADEKNAPLTLQEYRSQRNAILFKDIALVLAATAVMVYFAGIFAWAALVTLGESDGFAVLVPLVILGVAVFFIYIALSACKESVGQSWRALVELRDRYYQGKSPRERERSREHDEIIAFSVAGVAMLAFLVLLGVNIFQGHQLDSTYQEAISLVEEGAYEEARTLFQRTEQEQYMDSSAYVHLCNVLISYEKGEIWDAYRGMHNVALSDISPEQKEALDQFREKLKDQYEASLAKRAELEEKAREERIRKGVPFVGMRESDIANTSLGSPSRNIRHNTEIMNGNCYTANLYDFKVGSATIFTARCINGKVTQVWDKRNNPEYPYVPKPNDRSDPEEDPYHAKDYADAEDFYDDHYDDFYDYYDAEDYFLEHN